MITPVILQYKSGIPQKQFAYIRRDRFNTLKNEKGLTAREMLEYLLDKAEEKA